MTLNGWQRIWIVFAGFYFVVIAAYVFITWPPSDLPAKNALEEEWYEAVFNEVKTLPIYENMSAADYRNKDLNYDMGYPQLIKKIEDEVNSEGIKAETREQAKLKQKTSEHNYIPVLEDIITLEMHNIDLKYQVQLNKFSPRFIKVIYAFFSFTVPLIAIYLTGWSFAWVKRGFLK